MLIASGECILCTILVNLSLRLVSLHVSVVANAMLVTSLVFGRSFARH